MLMTETPAHLVTVPPFHIDRCEVTNAEFQRFVRTWPEWRKERVGCEYLWHWNGNRFPAADACAEWAGKIIGRDQDVLSTSYPPNPYGIFCLDEWAPYSAGEQRQTEADIRRMRAGAADRRIIRGGSFDGDAFNLRVTARDSHKAGNPVAHVGFRCAR